MADTVPTTETGNSDLVHQGERLDDLQISGRYIIQDPGRFCFGMDAVLLAHFSVQKPADRVVDLGTGTGIIPILMEAHQHGESYIGLEIQPGSADMAERSVRYNGLSDRISIVCGDIVKAPEILGRSCFDVVTSNPPYMIADHGITNPQDAKAIARHEILCTLSDLVRSTAALLVPGGRCYFVHRPFRLVDLMWEMRAAGLEPKRLRMVYPRTDKEPSMVLIEGARGGKPRLAVEPPLILMNSDGSYTDEVQKLYGF